MSKCSFFCLTCSAVCHCLVADPKICILYVWSDLVSFLKMVRDKELVKIIFTIISGNKYKKATVLKRILQIQYHIFY
jgi:hypothetical protein